MRRSLLCTLAALLAGAWSPAPAWADPPPALDLPTLEQMALRRNPTLTQAAAQVDAAVGRTIQARQYPNPLAGYYGQQIGSDGTAGQQGAYVQQMIVTGKRLKLNEAKFAREADQVRLQADAQQARVLNTVRLRFFEVLALQQAVALSEHLVAAAARSVEVTEGQVGKGKAEKVDLLEARLELQRARQQREATHTRYLASWQELAALVGDPCLPVTPLAGDLEEVGPELDWQRSYAHLLEASPELKVAVAEVARNRVALQRERVEPIPNILVLAGTYYDFADQRQQATAQIALRLPLWDQNEGNIRAAKAELARVQAEVGRTELSLYKRLARAFEAYRQSRNDVRRLRDEMLPLAQEIYQTRRDDLAKGKGQWSDLKEAQRDYFQYTRQYLQALAQVHQTEVAITGLLLVDGLDHPPPPPSQGQPQRQNEGQNLSNALRPAVIGAAGRELGDRVGNQGGQ